MEFPGFSVLPRPSASAALQRRVGEAMLRLRLLERLPARRKTWVYVEEAVEEGASLVEAHRRWGGRALPAAGLEGLPVQPEAAACPAGLWRVAVECMEAPSTGRYGFKGFFASLLVDLKAGEVFDCRGEAAR